MIRVYHLVGTGPLGSAAAQPAVRVLRYLVVTSTSRLMHQFIRGVRGAFQMEEQEKCIQALIKLHLGLERQGPVPTK